MKVDRLEIQGYRRLIAASAWLGRKTIALVGPNEAGKTSVLRSLLLFNSRDRLNPADSSRSLIGVPRDDDEDVATIWFELDERQREIVSLLPLRKIPTHFRFHKQVNGEVAGSLHPDPEPDGKLFERAAEAWKALASSTDAVTKDWDEEESKDWASVDEQITAYFERGSLPGERVWNRWLEVASSLPKPTKIHNRRLDAINELLRWSGPGVSLHSLVWEQIGSPSVPRFVLFGDSDRDVRSQYPISDEETARDTALGNLLSLAGTSLEELRGAAEIPQYRQTLVENATGRLNEYFTSVWSQEKVTVGFHVEGDQLYVDVRDLATDSAGWMSITDRSDGLRTFVALAAFLQANTGESPPILLIDEAEQHLHLNAQADLVRMLQELDSVAQVIYTTHSPGCLPADLGNGVRLVRPIEGGHSDIRHDFWALDDAGHVGFNPLLFSMGAGAAAFSSLRRALVVEGPGDMLLLPTLLRIATGSEDLTYQIAPGISSASRSEMAELDYAASRVAFMVDGDSAGLAWQAQLIEAGVPSPRVHLLGTNLALEDLLDRSYYLEALSWFGFETRQLGSLGAGPIKQALAHAAKAAGVTPPGPIAVVEAMLGRHEGHEKAIRISAVGKRRLIALHNWVTRTLSNGENGLASTQ